jgi:hypothetical protein
MAHTFACPRCQTALTLASDADFATFCATCGIKVPAPWVPQLSLEETPAPDSFPMAEPVAVAPTEVPAGAILAAPTEPRAGEPIPEVLPVHEALAPPAYDWSSVAVERQKLSPGWRRIPLGLGLVANGTLVMFLALLFVLLFAVIAGLQGVRRTSLDGPLLIGMGTHPDSMISADFLIQAEAVVLLVGGLLLIVGKLCCCGVPAASRLRPLAILSALLALLALFALYGGALAALSNLTAGMFGFNFRATGGQFARLLDAFGFFAGIGLAAIEILCFLMFLRGIGRVLESRTLSRGVVKYLVFVVVAPLVPGILVGLAILFEAMRVANPNNGDLLQWQNFCIGLVPLTVFAYFMTVGVWYVLLLRSAREVVHRARLGRVE